MQVLEENCFKEKEVKQTRKSQRMSAINIGCKNKQTKQWQHDAARTKQRIQKRTEHNQNTTLKKIIFIHFYIGFFLQVLLNKQTYFGWLYLQENTGWTLVKSLASWQSTTLLNHGTHSTKHSQNGFNNALYFTTGFYNLGVVTLHWGHLELK